MDKIRQIRDRVAVKQQELDGLLRRIDVLKAEVRTWEEAFALIAGEALDQAAPSVQEQTHTAAGVRRRKRKLTDHWQSLLRGMATDPTRREWSLGDMESLAARLGFALQRNTLRSQMSIYADRGFVRRVSGGVYEVTAAGAAEVGATLSKNDEPSPERANGSVVGEDDDAATSSPSLWHNP
jgi:hypothetical protein